MWISGSFEDGSSCSACDHGACRYAASSGSIWSFLLNVSILLLCSNKKLLNQYIEYIESLNQIKKSNNKSFYLVVKEASEQNSINEKISKIQDLLERCGNRSYVVNSKEEVIKIIETFYKIRRIE